MLEEHRGTLRIENRAARRVGDSDFIYSLSVDDAGFVLSYHERMMIDSSGQRDNAFNDTIVECRDAGDPDDDESLDEETLANMREGIEMAFGVSFTESEWQEEIEAASAAGNDTVPNGIIRWLEMLPVEEDGTPFKDVRLTWEAGTRF